MELVRSDVRLQTPTRTACQEVRPVLASAVELLGCLLVRSWKMRNRWGQPSDPGAARSSFFVRFASVPLVMREAPS